MFDAGTRAIPHTTQLVPETTERGIKRRNIVVSDNKMERLKTLLAHESNRCEKFDVDCGCATDSRWRRQNGAD